MKTLRRGDRGDEVEVLQHLLNVEGHKVKIDGDFGKNTEAALKLFQEVHDLEADGICGPKTWAALGCVDNATHETKAVAPSVVYLPLSTHITKSVNRPIKYLVIHYTAGSTSAPGKARLIKNVFERGSASADFAVDDREMVQFSPNLNNYYCWAVSGGNGITNKNSISIEICSSLKPGTTAATPNHEGWYFTEAVLDNAVKLAKILMMKFNIPLERVVRHYDVTGKLCPGLMGWNNGKVHTTSGKTTTIKNNSDKWIEFKKRLQ